MFLFQKKFYIKTIHSSIQRTPVEVSGKYDGKKNNISALKMKDIGDSYSITYLVWTADILELNSLRRIIGIGVIPQMETLKMWMI